MNTLPQHEETPFNPEIAHDAVLQGISVVGDMARRGTPLLVAQMQNRLRAHTRTHPLYDKLVVGPLVETMFEVVYGGKSDVSKEQRQAFMAGAIALASATHVYAEAAQAFVWDTYPSNPDSI